MPVIMNCIFRLCFMPDYAIRCLTPCLLLCLLLTSRESWQDLFHLPLYENKYRFPIELVPNIHLYPRYSVTLEVLTWYTIASDNRYLRCTLIVLKVYRLLWCTTFHISQYCLIAQRSFMMPTISRMSISTGHSKWMTPPIGKHRMNKEL